MAKDKGKGKKKDEGEEEEEESGGGGKKKIIMIVLALAAAGGVYKFVLAKPANPAAELTPEQVAAQVTAEQIKEALDPKEGEIVPMDEMILNLSGPKGGYLKITLALVLQEGTTAAEFKLELPLAADVAVQYLSSQNIDTFATAEGRAKVKEDLSKQVRTAYKEAKVERVLITAVVTQAAS